MPSQSSARRTSCSGRLIDEKSGTDHVFHRRFRFATWPRRKTWSVPDFGALMLSAESLKKIDREVAKYPADQKQSAVMAALIVAQDGKGWLATETMDYVAQYLGMPPVAVYEVATFYNMYNLAP